MNFDTASVGRASGAASFRTTSKDMEQAPPANGAGMEDAIYVRGKACAEIAGLPGVFRGVQRHVNHHRSADDVFTRHATPKAGIERILTVIAHSEITPGRHRVRKYFFFAGEGAFVRTRRSWNGTASRVGFLEAFAVDPDRAFADIDNIAGKSGDALHVVRLIGVEGRLEDDDLLAFRIAPQRNVNVGKRNSGVVANAAHDEVIADEQRFLHGTGRNDARLADGAVNEKKNEADPEPRDDSRRIFCSVVSFSCGFFDYDAFTHSP